MSEVTELYNETASLLTDAKELWQGINEKTEWDSWEEFMDNFNNIAVFVKKVVVAVENANVSLGEIANSAEKKATAVKLIDTMLVLPVYLEPFDGYLIGWAVDQIVAILNKTMWAEEEVGE